MTSARKIEDLSKGQTHEQGYSEARLRLSYQTKATSDIELLRVGVRNDYQGAALSLSGDIDTMFKKRSSNSPTLHAGFNKQSVKVDVLICSEPQGGESNQCHVKFRHKNIARGNLFRW